MAKTLVGLYDTFSDAERVVHDLVENGFSRSDINLATQDGDGRRADYTYTREELLTESGGFIDELIDLGVPGDEARSYAEGMRRGGSLVVVNASDDWADRGMEIMNRLPAVDIHARAAEWQQEGRTRAAAATAAPTTTDIHREQELRHRRGVDDKEATIPVVEEEISVGKRQVERGKVRVHTRVTERPVEESVRLREEKLVVERHPVDRPATEADLRASKEETIEITETAEEAVVSKRARVVEEVTVRKEAREHTETVRDTVRRKDVEVEPAGTARTTDARGFETYAADFRRHHTTAFAGSGTVYEDYEPAYRYGYDFGANERYRGRDWTALEADARRDWETRRPGTWERFKDAIRHGWESHRTGSHTASVQTARPVVQPEFESYATDFRQHCTTTFTGPGVTYEDCEPAYRYGYVLGTNERYRGRDWTALEADARRDWEAQRPGTWERFKDAIRYGWDKVRARA